MSSKTGFHSYLNWRKRTVISSTCASVPTSAVLVFHPDGVQHVLQDNHANYTKQTRAFAGLKPLLGNGLLVSDGDFWLRQRRLMQPAFHRQQINTFAEMMIAETDAMLDRWARANQPGKPINVQHEMMRLTLAIVTQALFGSKVGDPDGTLGKNIGILLGDSTFRFDHPFYPPLWAPTGQNRRFKKARAELDRVIYSLIASRRSAAAEQHDLLNLLMAAQDPASGQGMSDTQLRDEVMTLFLAGHETTAVSLSWTLYLLSQHPQVEARLRDELDETLGGRPPTLGDLPALSYTRMVLDESMRLYPPAWITERKALADDEICGYSVPAGTTVVVSPFATHRHVHFWTDPEVFDPQRFSAERSAGRPRYAYFPFGGGPRQCIGNNFALIEAQLILALIVQRCRLEMAPGWKVEPEPLVTLRPKGGLWMVLNQ